MSSSLASLVAVLGAGMGGYAQGNRMYVDRQRQDRLADQQQEEYDYQKGQRADAAKLKVDLAASQADQGVETVPGFDVGSMDGGDPAAQPVAGYKANGQVYGDESTARMALQGVNSRSSKATRAADVYRGAGQLDKAAQFDAFAKQALSEGSDQVLASISAGAPSLETLKKAGGKLPGTVGQQAADAFNQTGGAWKVSPDTKVEHYLDKTPTGREFVNSRVLGADGKPVVDDVHHAGLMLADLKTRLAQQNHEDTLADSAAKHGETIRHNKAEEDIQGKAADASRRQLSVALARLGLEQKQFDASTPAGKIKAIETATGKSMSDDQKLTALGVDKFSQPDRLMVQSLLKQQEKMDESLNKAKADGTWQPDSAGAKDMVAQSAILSLKLNRVLGKYGDAKGAPSADPLGIMGGKAPAAAPASPATRPAASGTSSRIPSPPPERVWVGNTYQENPAYTEWNQRYGEAARRQQAAENARLVAAYEGVRD